MTKKAITDCYLLLALMIVAQTVIFYWGVIMLCFRDKSFCSADCSSYSCDRKFTNKDKVEAERWWGGEDAPVAFMDFSKDCSDYKKKVTDVPHSN
jgi:hypothetical protein